MSARKRGYLIMKYRLLMKAKYSIMVRESDNTYDSEWMQVNSNPKMWVEELKSWTVGKHGVKRFSHVYWKQNHT
jgi:hypothetical protein